MAIFTKGEGAREGAKGEGFKGAQTIRSAGTQEILIQGTNSIRVT